jgi:hypothetical protein
MDSVPSGNQKPSEHVAYPRPKSVPGSAGQLRALRDGYFFFTPLLLMNIVWVFGGMALFNMIDLGHIGLFAVFLEFLFLSLSGILAGFVSYPTNKRIAFGMGWSPTTAVSLSIFSAISGCLCAGMPTILILYMLVRRRISQFGLPYPSWEYKRKEIDALIAEIEASPQYREERATPGSFQP